MREILFGSVNTRKTKENESKNYNLRHNDSTQKLKINKINLMR